MAEDQVSTEQPALPFVRAQDYKNLFANQLRMRVTPTEFTIYFGLIDEIQQGFNVSLESVGVIMTPAITKSLAEVLTQTIAVYEEQYGEIKPPSINPLDNEKMAAIVQKQKDKLLKQS